MLEYQRSPRREEFALSGGRLRLFRHDQQERAWNDPEEARSRGDTEAPPGVDERDRGQQRRNDIVADVYRIYRNYYGLSIFESDVFTPSLGEARCYPGPLSSAGLRRSCALALGFLGT